MKDIQKDILTILKESHFKLSREQIQQVMKKRGWRTYSTNYISAELQILRDVHNLVYFIESEQIHRGRPVRLWGVKRFQVAEVLDTTLYLNEKDQLATEIQAARMKILHMRKPLRPPFIMRKPLRGYKLSTLKGIKAHYEKLLRRYEEDEN